MTQCPLDLLKFVIITIFSQGIDCAVVAWVAFAMNVTLTRIFFHTSAVRPGSLLLKAINIEKLLICTHGNTLFKIKSNLTSFCWFSMLPVIKMHSFTLDWANGLLLLVIPAICTEHGTQRSPSGACENCPFGYFRNASLHSVCAPCPQHWTTAFIGASNEDDCSVCKIFLFCLKIMAFFIV